jgi:hypothetical protein
MGARAEIIRDLLMKGSYSVVDLQAHVARIQKRKKWSDSVIENELKRLPVTKDGNLYTIEPCQ